MQIALRKKKSKKDKIKVLDNSFKTLKTVAAELDYVWKVGLKKLREVHFHFLVSKTFNDETKEKKLTWFFQRRREFIKKLV